MYADDLLEPWLRPLLDEVGWLAPFDAHTHTGRNDPDGFVCSDADLEEALTRIGARALVFTHHDPGGYREANDRVLAEAAASGGRLVALARVDPHDDALVEAERCLAGGAA